MRLRALMIVSGLCPRSGAAAYLDTLAGPVAIGEAAVTAVEGKHNLTLEFDLDAGGWVMLAHEKLGRWHAALAHADYELIDNRVRGSGNFPARQARALEESKAATKRLGQVEMLALVSAASEARQHLDRKMERYSELEDLMAMATS